MRTLIGISIGATLVILAHTLGWPFLAWVLTRIPPATDPACTPSLHRYEHGELVEVTRIGG